MEHQPGYEFGQWYCGGKCPPDSTGSCALLGEQAVNVVAGRCKSQCGDGALPGLCRSLGYPLVI